MGIGPSHFMKEPGSLDEKRVQFIWEQAVMPYIEEQCFGDEKGSKSSPTKLKAELDRPTGSRRTVPAMRRIELKEYETHSANVRLEKDQIRALTDVAHIVGDTLARGRRRYKLTPSSYIGALNVGDLAVVIRPKIPIDRVMFLIAYAMDPKNWWRDPFEFARDDDVLEAIALAFAHRTRQAIQRGLLQGYRREEDALHTVRGRVRFGDQISRRFGIPLPIEVAFDEFTEDIEKNRLLKTAIHRLGHTFIRSPATRQELRALRPAFAMVGLGSYRRGALPEVQYSRLDEHYRPAVELARLIIENSSLELRRGEVAGAAFLIDMNKVFEQFLYVALGEALGLRTPMETRGKSPRWTKPAASR